MPFKDKEKAKQYAKEYKKKYYRQNRERIANWQKAFYKRNKQRISQYNKHYNETHKKQLSKKGKEYREKNREEVIKRRRESSRKFKEKHGISYQTYNNRKIKKEIFELLGNKCVVCGFDDWRALQIDHVKGGGTRHKKLFGKGQRRFYRVILTEIQGGSKDYQLLCANHNWIKRYENGEVPVCP